MLFLAQNSLLLNPNDRLGFEIRLDDCLVREPWILAAELWQNARKQKNPDSLQGIGILG